MPICDECGYEFPRAVERPQPIKTLSFSYCFTVVNDAPYYTIIPSDIIDAVQSVHSYIKGATWVYDIWTVAYDIPYAPHNKFRYIGCSGALWDRLYRHMLDRKLPRGIWSTTIELYPNRCAALRVEADKIQEVEPSENFRNHRGPPCYYSQKEYDEFIIHLSIYKKTNRGGKAAKLLFNL